MSASFPKSDSTTSLLKSSRRSTHLPDQTSEIWRGPHHHQHHHHRPAALQGSSGKSEGSFWSAEGDVSARRPLCHPSLVGSQDGSDTRATRGKCTPHAPHSQVPVLPGPNCELDRGVTERSRTNPKPSHRHHHHNHHHRRKHHREDQPDDPEQPHPCHTHTHRVSSLLDSTDERAPLCEQRDRKRGSLASGGGQVSSPSPSSCSPVPPSSRSSRRSRRSSTASSASDINLRSVLHSLFGQVRYLTSTVGICQCLWKIQRRRCPQKSTFQFCEGNICSAASVLIPSINTPHNYTKTIPFGLVIWPFPSPSMCSLLPSVNNVITGQTGESRAPFTHSFLM